MLSLDKHSNHQPYHVQKGENTRITDFLIQESFLLVATDKDRGHLSRQESRYYCEVIKKVSTKWLPSRSRNNNIRTVFVQEEHKVKTASCTPELLSQGEDYIDRLVSEKTSK